LLCVISSTSSGFFPPVPLLPLFFAFFLCFQPRLDVFSLAFLVVAFHPSEPPRVNIFHTCLISPSLVCVFLILFLSGESNHPSDDYGTRLFFACLNDAACRESVPFSNMASSSTSLDPWRAASTHYLFLFPKVLLVADPFLTRSPLRHCSTLLSLIVYDIPDVTPIRNLSPMLCLSNASLTILCQFYPLSSPPPFSSSH